MNIVEKALSIALEAHTGQVDKADQPYILHPIRLMLHMETENEMAAALLHDVIEDTSMTYDHLLKNGMPQSVIDILKHITKIDGESYDTFIDRVSKNDSARKIKIEDIKDNMNVNRLMKLTEEDLERLKKYHSALKKLNGS